jgi:hypothetical protein
MTPSIGLGASPLVNELYAMFDGAVCVTLRVEIAVSTPAITDDRSTGFNPCIYNGHQSADGSVREKRFNGLALNTTRHLLTFNRVAPVIFAPTELALVDPDGLVRTADLLGAALQVHEHGLSLSLYRTGPIPRS